mmetsp:Transcript_23665/g.57093  ORF Transcript_23665/g.57093 Transcript_23665/m.57093 type:complete len:202 (-) Transcript_23665:199-804(-)
MVLTEEQRKRMEENRKRAQEIKQKKKLERERNESTIALSNVSSVFEAGGFVGKSPSKIESPSKKRRMNDVSEEMKAGGSTGKGNTNKMNNLSRISTNTNQDALDDESSLEDFERDASPYISQTEAQRTYCIPLGTLAVCSYIERDNPHKRGWSKMKLYARSEVRSRAWKRFGGKEGLIAEREKRKMKRFEKDMADTRDVFR